MCPLCNRSSRPASIGDGHLLRQGVHAPRCCLAICQRKDWSRYGVVERKRCNLAESVGAGAGNRLQDHAGGSALRRYGNGCPRGDGRSVRHARRGAVKRVVNGNARCCVIESYRLRRVIRTIGNREGWRRGIEIHRICGAGHIAGALLHGWV